MAAGRATGHRDDSTRLPPLSLGLSSVRFIVNKLEAEYARVTVSDSLETGRELVKYDPNVDEGYDDYDDSPLVHPRGQVWYRLATNLGVALSRLVPSVTLGNFGVFAITTGFFAPRMFTYLVVYPFCRLVFGTLYPAYASYKAVRTKDMREYLKWMMYWIVFAFFTCTETFTDVFLSWFPFYYEVKILLVLWLLSPATKGSSILYKKFVHPALCRREQEIDEYIAKAKDQGYHTVLNLGTKGVNYATTVIMQTAIKGGGGLVQQLRKSYSLSDLTECDPREERGSDEADDVLTESRLIKRGGKSSGFTTRRSASESNSRSPMYFPEVDVDVRPRARTDEPDFSHIKSSEDISSGYSSADNSASLTRTASLGAAARARGRSSRTTVTTIKRPQAAEESEVIIEELQDDDSFQYTNMPPLVNLPTQVFLSHTQPPFLYQYVGDQVKIIQVLGNYPFVPSSNQIDNNKDSRDQLIVTSEESPIVTEETPANTVTNTDEIVNKENDIAFDIPIAKLTKDNNDDQSSTNDPFNIDETSQTDVNKEPINTAMQEVVHIVLDEHTETKNDISINDNDSAESDDEASFGTPENSPKSKRKSPKGKYGKGKAPAPPKANTIKIAKTDESEEVKTKDSIESNKEDFNTSISDINTTSQESLADIINKLPTFPETGSCKSLRVVNPISENKQRHKSKSPARMPKGNISGIGKLLQLPSKLAFWSKTEDKLKTDEMSISSDDHSRRSSTVERAIDDFQSCSELNTITLDEPKISETQGKDIVVLKEEPADDSISFKDASDLESEIISQDIIDKSDALQKLIEAKIESHPEYKYISLHDEGPASSKTTDV